MKQVVTNYTFDKNAGTVTFPDFASIALERVLLITNVTRGQLLFQFNNPALGGTAAGNVLSLATDTSALDSADKLQIIYASAAGDPQYGFDRAGPALATKVTTAGSVTYVALAAPGTPQATAAWQCRKIDESSGTVITWADGNSNFDNIATSLTSLTYS